MTDSDIELVAAILSRASNKFWVVIDDDRQFYCFGGSPYDLAKELNSKISSDYQAFIKNFDPDQDPFMWRDQFDTPNWDQY